MHCEHCLRGDFEDCCMDADFNMIPEIFDGVESIGCITFTGGEPSLNHEFITACVDYIEKKDIYVGGVFIATNGLIYCQELVDAVRRLWLRNISSSFISNKVHYSGNGLRVLLKMSVACSLSLYLWTGFMNLFPWRTISSILPVGFTLMPKCLI